MNLWFCVQILILPISYSSPELTVRLNEVCRKLVRHNELPISDIARAIHDGLAQVFTSIMMRLQTTQIPLLKNPAEAHQAIRIVDQYRTEVDFRLDH